MIFNVTYVNKDYTKYSNEILGKPYSLLQRLKRGGVGSGRFIIAELSKQFLENNKQLLDINYANIEMRSKGIIVHVSLGSRRYAWIVPFYKLHVYGTGLYSIHADGGFVKLKKDKRFKSNKKFLSNMINEKINYLQLGYYDG